LRARVCTKALWYEKKNQAEIATDCENQNNNVPVAERARR